MQVERKGQDVCDSRSQCYRKKGRSVLKSPHGLPKAHLEGTRAMSQGWGLPRSAFEAALCALPAGRIPAWFPPWAAT